MPQQQSTAEDHYEVTGLLGAMDGVPPSVRTLIMPGPPHSKTRIKFGRGRTYQAKGDRSAEQRTAAFLRQWVTEPKTGNLALVCLFYRPNYQRIDTDNLLKHVCDSANGVLWVDDSQVTALAGMTRYDKDAPRTVIGLAPHVSTMTRGTDAVYPCAVCGEPISRIGRTRLVRACSRECATRLKGYEPLDIPVPCGYCGQPFRRVTGSMRYCSQACRVEVMRGKRQPGKPKSRCTDCDTQLDHYRGGRCRDCWRASVAANQEALL